MSYEKQLVRCAKEVLEEAVKSWLDENRNEIIAELAQCELGRQSGTEQKPGEVEQVDPAYFTPGQLAARWGSHPESVRRLLRLGKLPRVWIGKRVLVPVEASRNTRKTRFYRRNDGRELTVFCI